MYDVGLLEEEWNDTPLKGKPNFIRDLIRFRRSIKQSPAKREDFRELEHRIIESSIRTGLFDRITDALLIEDLYDALVNRSQIISDSSAADPGSIWYINAKCLDLCERILREVDWTKYNGWWKGKVKH